MTGNVATSGEAAFAQGLALHRQGRLDEAEAMYDQALRAEPAHFHALHLSGLIALQRNRAERASALIGEAVRIDPKSAVAHLNYGAAQHQLGRLEAALASYQMAIALQPDCAEAFFNQGNALRDLSRPDAAVASYDRALVLKADYTEAHLNRGLALSALGRRDAAIASYERALSSRPNYADAHYNHGNELYSLRRYDAAVASYDRALALEPGHVDAHLNRGSALVGLRRYTQALASYQAAISLRPEHAEAFINVGGALQHLKHYDAAVAAYDAAVAIRPNDAEALGNRATALRALKQYEAAIAGYDRAIACRKDAVDLIAARRHLKMMVCDWSGLACDMEMLASGTGGGRPAFNPFYVLSLSDSAQLQKLAAENWVARHHPADDALPAIPKRPRSDRLHIGYFSADFHDHPTFHWIAELLELHDRSRFRVTAFSFGPHTQSAARQRLAAGCDDFIDVRDRSDTEVATLARSLGVDIAVDLKGFMEDSRPGIFALRAAPVQVNYIGYPGTMGAEYIDYLIADRTLIPEATRALYAEKIVYLPDSYQPNDRKKPIADRAFGREELGLPPRGFVFCCFNNSYKITPGVFECWMRILGAVEDSVLWLLECNPQAAANLRREAAARQVDPGRLIFAPRMALADHLARHRAADLFLDTLPCNAHTTASDSLWAGVPVLTCAGEAFASRVAASLLTSIGLPELIASSLEAYEQRAIELANRPHRLDEIKRRLSANRLTSTLFDTPRFARNLEAAYIRMYERYRADLAPDHLDPESGDDTAADTDRLVREARALHQQGRLPEARSLYERALQADPRHDLAWYGLGVIACQSRQPRSGVELIRKALSLNPHHGKAYHHLGNAHLELGEHEAAIDSYDRAIAADPEYAETHYNRGNALFDLNRFEAAVASYDRAIALKCDHAAAHRNRGLALSCLKRPAEALADYDRAIALEPDDTDAYDYKGNALRDLLQFERAIVEFDRAIALNPNFAEAYNSRGTTFSDLKRYAAALDDYTRAIALKPDFAEAYSNRGNVLKEQRRRDEALASYTQAIALRPDFPEGYYNRGEVHRGLGHYEASVADYDRAFALEPALKFLLGQRRHAKMHLCDWDGLDEDLAELSARIERGEPAAPPFIVLSLSADPSLQRRAAETWMRIECPANSSLPMIPKHTGHDRIKIGYFSADFREHPVASLIAEVIEAHDRSRFEVTAFSFGPESQDAMRARLQRAFDRFIDVRDKSDREIALLARDMQLDIAVDLGGFTEDCRSRVFALRAAPLQLSYLGYLGTMAAPYMDYLIADRTIVPPADRHYYAEKILALPSYQANDSQRCTATQALSREELGLPHHGFVFCCFNGSYKISPGTFAGWMRILQRAPDSVLFLYAGAAAAEGNLRMEAERRGVDPARLLFGRRLPFREYLARYGAADLFLDTLPYNAGTTASDALWAGLPVLTCRGETFAGRVAASLLTAVGLPELIASSQQQYEQIAIELAGDAPRLARIKQRLAEQRLSSDLFDARRFTRGIEAGFSRIHERWQADLPPDHIDVSAQPASLDQGASICRKSSPIRSHTARQSPADG